MNESSNEQVKIYPKCKLRDDQVMAVRYDGYVVPCCHFGGPTFKQLQQLLGDKVEQMHVTSGTLDEINRSEAYYLLEQSFETNPPKQCQRMCGKKEHLDTNKTLANSEFKQTDIR